LSKDVRREKDRIIKETQKAGHYSYLLTEGRGRMERNRSRLGVGGTLMQWNMEITD